jgi:hypothetical protein
VNSTGAASQLGLVPLLWLTVTLLRLTGAVIVTSEQAPLTHTL